VLVDTSVSVAAMLSDHEGHASARDAIRGTSAGLAGHAWFETYSVLTRLPSPQRRSGSEVVKALDTNFPSTRWLSETQAADYAQRCPALGIAGGAVYDGLIGAVAVASGLPLITRDRRALPIYAALGVDVRVIT
jgi:predicted nucleic acid-binding protein